jgi:tetratricopeptide (TPR) repeat protein
MVTALTTSLEVFNLPSVVGLAITGGATILAGLIAWGTQRAVSHAEHAHKEVESGVGPPAQLPPVIAHFTGRTEALDELRRVLEDNTTGKRSRDAATAAPLVLSLHGPGGVGKSSLAGRFAHEIAGRFPDGQLYFDLRGGEETRVTPEEVLTGFLPALGARLTIDPGGLPELQKLWWTWLKDKRVLVYLDNARDAEQVQALLPPEAGCAVLITSRQPLFLRNTYDLRLTVFTQSQGLELLARLAGGDRVAADLDAAREVVELCGHLPLAISICGGRLATRENWSLRMMADRLGDERRRRLDELEVAQSIDQSVRASLQLSYDDCTEVQRRLLRRLGLLAAPDIQGWAAGDLLGSPEIEGGDHLEALVDAQLVEYSGQDATGEMRYRLHNLVRLYARERADKEDGAEERRTAIERVMDGYRERAEQVAAARWPQDWHRQGGHGAQRPDPAGLSSMDWLTSERPALVAGIEQAAELGMWELVWRVGRAVCSLCHSMRVFWPEWRIVADFTCEAAGQLGDERRLGIALLERAAVVGGQGQIEPAQADAEQALQIFRELREGWWAGRAMRTVAMNLRSAGNVDEAQRYFADAIDAFATEGDRWWHARVQRNLAELRHAQRRYEEARELLEQARDVFHRDGHRYSEAQTLRVLGEVLAAEGREALRRGDRRTAHSRFSLASLTLDRATELFRLRHETWEEARCLRAAGDVGDPANGFRELRLVRQARDMLEGLGDSWGVARTRLSEGRAFGRLGRYDEAVEAMRQAADDFRDLGDRWLQARSLRTMAEVLVEARRPADAREPARQALDMYLSLGNESGVARAHAVLAETEAAQPCPPP